MTPPQRQKTLSNLARATATAIGLLSITCFGLTASTATCQQQFQQQQQNASQHHPLATILAQEPMGAVNSIYGQHSAIEPHAPRTDTLSSLMLKTFIRTNNMRAYHLDLHSYREDAKFVGDPEWIDSTSEPHKLRCKNHMNHFKQLLDNFSQLHPVLDNNSLDSLRLADAFGRPEAGALAGNQFWLGDYDNCRAFTTRLAHKEQPEQLIKGHYCLGITQWPNWNPQDGKTSIKIGLCLPETCTSSMINENSELLGMAEGMMKQGCGKPFDLLKLRQVYCLPHETSQIRQYSTSAKAFVAFVGFFLVACLTATTIDHLNSKLPEDNGSLKKTTQATGRNWRIILIESFSIRNNLERFLHIRESKRPYTSEGVFNEESFLNSTTGIKCIGLILIISAHTFLVSPTLSSRLIGMDGLTQTYLANVYLSAHLLVDTFFALSGLLASYFIFKEGIDKIKTGTWLVLTVHRYWRLTPIYLICYWYTKSVGFLTSDGPLWDYKTAEQSPRLNCAQESWWEAILHLSDFKSPKDHCVPFAWFTANSIKFWIVTPIFLILIHKSMRRGYQLTIGTLLANIILVGVLAFKSSVDIKSLLEFKPESADNMLNNMGQVYTRPYSRIGPYLIGLLAGHLLYLIESNKLELKLSKNAKIIIWTLFSVTVIVTAFIVKIAGGIELDEVALPYIFSASSALIRPLWALSTCWFIFALAHGQAQWISSFLTAKVWRLLVKLSFCAYLAQGEVIAQMYLSTPYSAPFTYIDMVTRPIVATTATFVVSFFVVLLIEYPLTGIEELILPRRHKCEPQTTAPTPTMPSKAHTNVNNTITTQEPSEKLKST